jgi:hypothetical protein
MAQHRLHDLDVRAGCDGQGSRGVPECMRGQRRQSRGRDGRFKAGPPEVAGAQHAAARALNTNSSDALPATCAARSSTRKRGIGTDRLWWVLGVLNTARLEPP